MIVDEWVAKPQRGVGLHHYMKDLPKNLSGWGSKIADEMKKLDNEGLRHE